MIRVLLTLLACLVVVGTAAVVYLATGDAAGVVHALISRWDAPVSDDPTPRVFRVGEGQSAAEIGSALEKEGLIRFAIVFRLIARARGVEGDLRQGEFELRANMTTGEIVDALVAGGRGRTVTIPEGWRAIEIARQLEAAGYVGADEFMAVVRSPGRIAPYDQLLGEPPTLEGYLFPDTYEIAPGTTPEAIVERMVRQFDAKFETTLRQRAEELGLTLHQAVTLASIVEREAAVPAERGLIAGVFHNRLRADMPLQADPTIQYAVANQDLPAAASFGFWKKQLTAEDLAMTSPFNTYLHKGLPPGPICSPGLAALRAAVDPEPTDYLYFVAREDGSHVFARTLEEHQRNVHGL